MPESVPHKTKPIAIVLAIGLLLYSGANISSILLHSLQNRQRLQDLQRQVSRLQQQKDDLQKTLSYEQSDQFVEQTARNQLGMARPNETVVIFPRQSDVLGSATQAPATQTKPTYISASLQSWIKFFWQ